MGKLVHLADVANKFKKLKIDIYNPPDPMKTTPLENNSSFLEQKKHSPQHFPCGVTAVVAVMKAGPELRPKCKKNKKMHCSKKIPKQKIIRILLNSGSDSDLLFQKKGAPKSYPYLTRQVPKSWSTSNGIFHIKGKDSLNVFFV